VEKKQRVCIWRLEKKRTRGSRKSAEHREKLRVPEGHGQTYMERERQQKRGKEGGKGLKLSE